MMHISRSTPDWLGGYRPGVCPTCGRCPTCGHRRTVPYVTPMPYPVIPYVQPIYPLPWYQPSWTTCVTP